MSIIKYRECISAAAVNLGLDDVVKALESNQTSFEEKIKKEIDMLLKCMNSVIHEIACDYSPLKKSERLKSSDYRIYYRDFSKNIIDVFSVSYGERSVAFRQYHDCILVPNEGAFVVEYSYAPVKGTLETSLEWNDERVSPRIVGYGAACEYCILNGMTDDAVLWDKRFKDALFKGNTPKCELKIKLRKWI